MSMEKLQKLEGFDRTFPIQNDVRYRANSYNPKSPYVPKGNYAVATNIVAIDGSGDFEDIQSAIDDLPAGGGVVYIKEGTYNISSTITINKSNVSLIGAGKSTKIQTSIGINIFSASSKTGLLITNIFFYGSKLGDTCINFVNVEKSFIRACWFQHSDTAVNFAGTTSECYIEGSNAYDCGLSFALTNDANICTFINNSISSCTNGIRMGDYCVAINNYCFNNTEAGIWLHGYPGHPSKQCSVIGNVLKNNTGHGIEIYGYVENSVFSSNLCIGNNSGIMINGYSHRNTMIGNVCQENLGYGIYIPFSSSTKNIITANILSSNTFGGLGNSGVDTQIGHNITS